MVSRFKFRVWGGAAPGKYVFILEDGAELFLTPSFAPSLEQGPGSALFLTVRDGRTMVTFLRDGIQWNGKAAPAEAVAIHPGHLIGCKDEIVEILECSEETVPTTHERTRFVDLNAASAEPLQERSLSRQSPGPAVEAPLFPPPEPTDGLQEDVLVPELALAGPAVEIVNIPPALPGEPEQGLDPQEPLLKAQPEARNVPPQAFALPQLPNAAPPPAANPAGKGRQRGISGIQPIPDGSARIRNASAMESVAFSKAMPNAADGGHSAKRKSSESRRQFNWQAAGVIVLCLAALGGLRVHKLARSLTEAGPAYSPMAATQKVPAPRMAQKPAPVPPEPVAPPASPAPPVLAQAAPAGAGLGSSSLVSPGPAGGSRSPASAPQPESAAENLPASPTSHEASPALGAFLKALEDGDIAAVQEAVEKQGLSQDFSLDEAGRAPLLRAAAFGRLSVMKYLLSQKADLNALDFVGNNALMWATINGHGKTVQFLVEAGLDPRWKRDDGADALRLSRTYGQKQIELILRKAAGTESAKGRKPASRKKPEAKRPSGKKAGG